MTDTRAFNWHAAPLDGVADRLKSDAHKGLSAAAAAARLAEVGPNIITPHAQRSWLVRLLAQFHAPLVYILLLAGVITVVLAEYLDAAVIFGVVVVNAAIGFVQESKALAAIDSLSRSMKMEASVRRDGRRMRLDAAELVPGDVVLLEGGDRVPADLRLAVSNDLHTDESMLTGESLPVAKHSNTLDDSTVLADRRNMAFAGSLVTRGTGEGLVVLTGDSTEVGRISAMISAADQLATPLTQKIAGFSHLLLKLILAIAAIAFVVGLLRGKSAEEMFMASVALAVGAIPEGLPAAVTIMLAVGVSRMASRRAIIRKLPAVETLGSTTVICSDKTGTLTQNQMTVTAVWTGAGSADVTGAGYDPTGRLERDGVPIDIDAAPALRETLVCGALCNDASLVERGGEGEPVSRWQIQGDPTEASLLVSARKAGFTADGLTESLPRVDVIPFESEHQFMATMHKAQGVHIVYVKGSAERIVAMSEKMLATGGEPVPIDPEAVKEATAALSGKGLRVLAFAVRRVEGEPEDLTHDMVKTGLTFLGLQGMLDPPRAEAIEAVKQCRGAGVRVKMITGDHAMTASTIAGMIGIGVPTGGDGSERPAAISGAQLAEVTDDELPRVAEDTDVFARMTPEQKLRLVKALQGTGNVVAMTGDGVNDAPALRQADIGIAMGITGTEVAKEAADMVLADDNFASIEAAVEEGRCVYDNLTKFIAWTLPTNGGEAFVILASIGLNTTLPILPVHALYINMTTGILMGVPLVFERKETGIMNRPPRDPSRPILTHELFMRTCLVSLVLCVGALGLFEWELSRGASEQGARTAAASVIVVGEMFYLFSARSKLRAFWTVPLFSNMWLWAGIAAMGAVHAAFVYVPVVNRLFSSAPIDGLAWAKVFAIGFALLVIVEIEKAIRRAVKHGGTERPDEA